MLFNFYGAAHGSGSPMQVFPSFGGATLGVHINLVDRRCVCWGIWNELLENPTTGRPDFASYSCYKHRGNSWPPSPCYIHTSCLRIPGLGGWHEVVSAAPRLEAPKTHSLTLELCTPVDNSATYKHLEPCQDHSQGPTRPDNPIQKARLDARASTGRALDMQCVEMYSRPPP